MTVAKRVRWWVARCLNSLPGQCWADLVSWATGSRFYRWPWQPRTPMCVQDAAENGRCYCGKVGGDRG